MKRTVKIRCALTLSAIFASLIFGGCTTGYLGDPPEAATPTGCLKSKGRYFDPKQRKCVEVNDRHTAFVLDAYRYLNDLAEKSTPGPLEYDIYPQKYLTIEQAEALWLELRDHGAAMISMGGDMPGNREYDPELGMQSEGLKKYIGTPKVWGVGAVADGCGWMKRDDAPPANNSIEGMLDEGLKTLEKERPRPQLRKAVLVDRDCRISGMRVLADPKFMRDWWDQHLNDVEGIQPLVDVWIDKTNPGLGPMTPLKEGE